MQGVEPDPRGRPGLDRPLVTTTPAALGADTWRHVAFIEQRARSATIPATAATLPLADGLRRLQALHPRRVPRRLPDRRDLPHRVRHRRRAAGHLQRLRLLRPRLPVRRDRHSARTTGASSSARSATTDSADGLEPACAKACPTDSIQFGAARRAARARRRPGRGAACRAAWPRRASTAQDPDDGVGGDGAFFLLLDEPEVYGLPPDPVVTTRDLPSMWRHVGGRRRARWRARRGGVPAMSRRVSGGRRRAPPTTATRSSTRRPGRSRHRRLPLPRRAGRRLVAARRRGAADRASGELRARVPRARAGAIARLARRAHPRPRPARRDSSTCCAYSSRPRR